MNYYDKIAKSYDELHKEEQLRKLKIIKDNLKIKSSDLLLDVGCGTGISSDFKCDVIGIDPSLELLKINPNKNKVLGRGEYLPFKDNQFDVIVSLTAIHNFNDIEKGLQEIRRIGKKRFVLSVLKKSKKYNKIFSLIRNNFSIIKIIEEGKDTIFYLES